MSNNAKTSVRVSSNAFKPLRHIEANCELIDSIIKDLPEISDLKESYDPRKTRTCKHNCICYEVECGFAHTFTLEARKKIRKVFLKKTKAKSMKDKIQNEIAKLGRRVSRRNGGIIKTFDWIDSGINSGIYGKINFLSFISFMSFMSFNTFISFMSFMPFNTFISFMSFMLFMLFISFLSFTFHLY
jgi:hypothetical protein